MAKTLRVNDTDYGPEEIREHRKLIIELRDGALKQNNFHWTVILYVTVALLSFIPELLESSEAGDDLPAGLDL